jgi:hypothetical protein
MNKYKFHPYKNIGVFAGNPETYSAKILMNEPTSKLNLPVLFQKQVRRGS